MVEDAITIHTIIIALLILELDYSPSDNVALFWIIYLDTVAHTIESGLLSERVILISQLRSFFQNIFSIVL